MEQIQNRRGENSIYAFRSARFFTVKDEWWFAIRRGADQGPYSSKKVAQEALMKFLYEQFKFEDNLTNTG